MNLDHLVVYHISHVLGAIEYKHRLSKRACSSQWNLIKIINYVLYIIKIGIKHKLEIIQVGRGLVTQCTWVFGFNLHPHVLTSSIKTYYYF